MIIISDCFTSKVDEGCLKVANTLTKKIKLTNPETIIVSYHREPTFSDKHLKLNKLFLNKELFSTIRKKHDSILYIPFASNTTASVLRVLVLSIFGQRPVSVIFVLRFNMNPIAKILLRLSRANVIALSKDSYFFYKGIVGRHAHYLKTGIDTALFLPVSLQQKAELRKKYNIHPDAKVVVHVGHLKAGRNIDKLLDVDPKYFVLLVVSSITEKDADLRAQLENRTNIRVVDSYIKNIQEIYQLADVYMFPVQALENCIDVPLSVLEAAACNIPVVTTQYGELKEFKGTHGFHEIKSCKKTEINTLIGTALNMEEVDTRNAVLDYDWMKSVVKLASIVK